MTTPTPPPELVIFDCDGVLVDSERLSVKVEAKILAELGWPLTEADIVERFLGLSDEDFTAIIEERLGRSLGGQSWMTTYAARYAESFERELTAVDGVAEALEAIEAAGARTCVASSGGHAKLRMTLTRTGLWDRFEGRIFSSSEVANGKPAPDLFLHAAERIGVAPGACAVVEDSRFGLAGARAAGMRTFGYAGGITPAHVLEGPGTVVFHDMRELPELVLGTS
jgi:HAD superfamily hydrolase (TIGR01509 family)